MKILTIILALLIPQMAMARIGESREQCKERYGKGTDHGKFMTNYYVGNFRVTAQYPDSSEGTQCATIIYQMRDGSAIDAEAIGDLLMKNSFQMNGKATPWKATGNDIKKLEWLSTWQLGIHSGSLSAHYDRIEKKLYIMKLDFVVPNIIPNEASKTEGL